MLRPSGGGVRLPFGLLALAFVSLVLLGIGVGLLWWAGRARGLAADAPGFSLVSGVVDHVGFRRIGRGPQGRRFRVEARYSYEVGGVAYTGDVVGAIPPEFMTEEEGRAWLEACNVREGGPIDVFHDPSDPARAVLIREAEASFGDKVGGAEVGGWVVLGVLATLVGTFALVPGLRRRVLAA